VEHLSKFEPGVEAGKGGDTAGARGTDVRRALEQVAARTDRRSLVVLLSDLFTSSDALAQGLARLSHRRHDVVVLQVLDGAERRFGYRGPVEFVGLEGELARVRVDPAAVREAYLAALNRHMGVVQNVTRRLGFDYALLDSGASLGLALRQFLTRRWARMSKSRR